MPSLPCQSTGDACKLASRTNCVWKQLPHHLLADEMCFRHLQQRFDILWPHAFTCNTAAHTVNNGLCDHILCLYQTGQGGHKLRQPANAGYSGVLQKCGNLVRRDGQSTRQLSYGGQHIRAFALRPMLRWGAHVARGCRQQPCHSCGICKGSAYSRFESLTQQRGQLQQVLEL